MSPTVQRSLTLRWLHAQTPDLIGIMREYYADHLEMPIIEVCETFESDDELAWVWAQFGREICAFSKCAFPEIETRVERTF